MSPHSLNILQIWQRLFSTDYQRPGMSSRQFAFPKSRIVLLASIAHWLEVPAQPLVGILSECHQPMTAA
jgi:hypothetical protein